VFNPVIKIKILFLFTKIDFKFIQFRSACVQKSLVAVVR
jgi:hypothetical protein